MLVDGVTSVTFLCTCNLITSSLLGLGPILMKYKGLYTSLVGEEWLEPKIDVPHNGVLLAQESSH